MTEERFWMLIEQAWEQSPSLINLRNRAIAPDGRQMRSHRDLTVKIGDYGKSHIYKITSNLEDVLYPLSQDELVAFARIFERLLWDLDRKDLYDAMGGDNSGDGFLYARAFVIGMGQRYHDLIVSDVSNANSSTEAGLIAFTVYMIHNKKFGSEMDREVEYKIESFHNSDGWPA